MLSRDFFGRREVAKGYADLAGTDHDGIRNAFDNRPLCRPVQFWPTSVQIFGLSDDLIAGQVIDPEEVDRGLQARDLLVQFLLTLLQRTIEFRKALGT